MNTLIIALALCFTGALAQRHSHSHSHSHSRTRCVAPEKWEGMMIQVDPLTAVERVGSISYDASNERLRFVEEVYHETAYGRRLKESYEYIYLHREDVMYRIDLSLLKCKRFSNDQDFPRIEVPEGANFSHGGYVGSSVSGAGVRANVFSGVTKRGLYIGSWTRLGCIPISETYFGRQNSSAQTNYYDITLGIVDTDIFIPPRHCH